LIHERAREERGERAERKRDIKITGKKRNCAKDVRSMEEKRYLQNKYEKAKKKE
jgi:hypothetical protein